MRLYRALLYAFPTSFRHEYGDEMSTVAARRLREASGPLDRVGVWISIVVDLLVSAARVQADVTRQDLASAVRTLRHARGFAATAVIVCALGVGAATAAFSVTDHVLLRPLPFPESERLVKLWQNELYRGYSRMELSPLNYRDWKRMSRSFDAIGAYVRDSANLVGEGPPTRLDNAKVTFDLLSLVGVAPLIGRTFTAEEDREGADGTVILSYGLWIDRFGGDPAVLGRSIRLGDSLHTVIGVMPPGFSFPSRDMDLWTPIRLDAQAFSDRRDCFLVGVGRVRADASIDQARADLQQVAAQLEREYPKDNAKVGATVVRMRDEVSQQGRLLLTALFGAALCVLLIACTNLASLLLARAMVRRKELAVRTALGAGRERLVRQLVTESLVLAAIGGGLGVVLAVSAAPLLARLVPTSLPIAETPSVDFRMLAFAAVMTTLTALGFGAFPALRVFGDASANDLREGTRAGIGGARERLRSTLVVAEIAISVVLLAASGLLIRALWKLQAVDPGFRTENVLTLQTPLPWTSYAPVARRQQFYNQVIGEVLALPGVTHAAYISFTPMTMRGGIWAVELDRDDPKDTANTKTASLRFVTPGFFGALSIPLRRGRDVSESDVQDAPFVAVVSESFVRSFLPGEDPIGRRFRFGLQERTIVGIVGDVRVRGLERDSEPQVYLPSAQVPDGGLIFYAPKDLVIRARSAPDALTPAIRQIIAKADVTQPVSDVRLLTSIVDADTAPRALQVRVLAAFAAVAMMLAAVGIHGLLAYTVSTRLPEFGVRIALGATAAHVLGLVLRESLVLAGVGIVVGLALGLGAGQSMQALLAGVSPRDGWTFGSAIGLVAFVTLAGSLVPALRAIRVDPMTVMRSE